jgi:transcriptional regulator with XRE-family HTH domain
MKTFGAFLKSLRQSRGMSLRQLASEIEVAPSYLSDIENDNRNAPNKERLDNIIEKLKLSEEEAYKLFDLAGQKNSSVADDVKEIIAKDKQFAVLARKIKKEGLDVTTLIKSLEKKNKGTIYLTPRENFNGK